MKLFKNVLVYGVSNAWSSGVSYFLILFLTLYISPEGIGLITNFQYLGNLLLPLIGLSSIASVNREYFNEKIPFRVLIWQVAYLLLFTLLVLVVLGVFLGSWVASLTALPLQYVGLALLFAFFFQTVETRLSIFRLQDKALLYGVWKVGRGVLEIGITVGSIYLLSQDWSWRIASLVVANGLLFAVVIIHFSKLKFESLNKEVMSQIVKYSLPLVPNALLAVAIGFTDKLFITHYFGLATNGIYSVAFQLGMIISLLQNSFNQAWVPWFYGEMNKEQVAYKKIFKFSFLFVAVFFVVCLTIVVLAPTVMSWLNKTFLTPNAVVIFIMAAFFFNGVYKIFVNYLFFHRETRWILAITASSAIINVALNAALVPTQGMVGAATATFFSFFAQFVITASVVQVKYKLPWFSIFQR